VNPISERLPEAVSHALNLMREQLDERPHQHLRLRDMARRSGVTEKHLCRVFSKALGHAPMKTFQLLKLQLALALLARSNLSVKGIADRCGFEDPLYFTRCFRRVYGAPPTEVRQSLMQGHRPPRSPLPAEVTPRIHW
jgi:AraC-like DNA-binding protein